MKKIIWLCIIISLQTLFYSNVDNKIIYREEFSDLDNWENFCLPGTKCIIKYNLEKDSNEEYLRINTDSSVTGLIYKKIFNPYDFPIINWKWKIDNIFKKGDGEYKMSDDYPIRIFVLFEKKRSDENKLRNFFYNIIQKKYGYSLPHSSIVYVWESKIKNEKYIVCPYSKIIRYIPVQMGDKNIKKWIEEEMNIIESYKLAFGELPPKRATIALMADSDNVREQSTAYIDYIELSRKK
jgi:hypothetical protein